MERIGLALGGGGARGLAHVVVLEAFDELGIRPHAIVGTSIGAVIGVLYCAGQSAAELRASLDRLIIRDGESLRSALADRRLFKWLDFVAPQFEGAGLIRSEKFVSFLFESIRAENFDQLSIPLRVVAADFWNREEVVLDSGPLQTAVQASMSLPGLFAPVMLDNRLLVDGGAVNPVPFDRLPDDCTVRVAVDVIGQREHVEGEPPSLSESIFNTFQIMEKSIVRAKLQSAQPDIYLEVDVRGVRLLEFFKAPQVFAQAERAKQQLKRALIGRLGLA